MMTKQAELKKQAYASNLKSRALSIFIYLIDRSNKELTCYPAIPTMAEHLHISQSTVKRALKELVETGYIKKDSRFRENNHGQSSNLYTLILKAEESEHAHEYINKPNQGDYIEPTEQMVETDTSQLKTAKHITFADIAPKQEQTTQNATHEVPQQLGRVSQSTNQLSVIHPCPPVHSAILNKMYLTHFTATSKTNSTQFLPCIPHSFQWTGAEVNLIPP